jgi:hypothetical protein
VAVRNEPQNCTLKTEWKVSGRQIEEQAAKSSEAERPFCETAERQFREIGEVEDVEAEVAEKVEKAADVRRAI